jgi:aminoglycoside phosphotransferase (APT) family kinase protein
VAQGVAFVVTDAAAPPGIALAAVPGWTGAPPGARSSEPLPGGLDAASGWRVRTPEGDFALKVARGAAAAAQMPTGAALQALAAQAGLAPGIAAAGVAGDVAFVVSEFVQGAAWDREDMRDAAGRERLGAWLRALRSVPVAAVARGPSLQQRVGALATRVLAAAPLEAQAIRGWLSIAAGACAQLGARGRPDALVHSDVHHGNVLGGSARGGRDLPLLVDWDYAHRGDPLQDLGSLLARYPEIESDGPLWLDAAGLAAIATPAELAAMIRVHQVLHLLWFSERRVLGAPPGAAAAAEERALRVALAAG